jgi:hypothetical protein
MNLLDFCWNLLDSAGIIRLSFTEHCQTCLTCLFVGLARITGDFFEEWNEITPPIHIRKFEEQTA